MLFFLIILSLIPQICMADIFAKYPDKDLDNALAQDARNFYYRSGFDYNASEPVHPEAYEFRKENISLGCNRFKNHTSLENFITNEEFDRVKLGVLMTRLSNSGLLIWQYSSPTLADLYKHLDTTGRLNLGMRSGQCEDLEKSIDDPVIKLRKQAIMDCLKHADNEDIEAAFKHCFDNPNEPYRDLEDPGNGSSKVSDAIDVTQKTLDRVVNKDQDTSTIENILPHLLVSPDRVTIKEPRQTSRFLIASYRKDFLDRLTKILNKCQEGKAVSLDELSALSVFGIPLTEGQVRNIAMLDPAASHLAISKVASQLAYLKTMDQYLSASQLLNRVMIHPAIEPGYKTLLNSSVDFVQKEIVSLKEEKERLTQYFDTMHTILDEADKQRLKALAVINQEKAGEEQKGIFKLNP
jgi:hypothetical protein